ncbi:MAG: hypothetical protein QW341_04780, partial [Candidatus Bathyarchaeia archaeon]
HAGNRDHPKLKSKNTEPKRNVETVEVELACNNSMLNQGFISRYGPLEESEYLNKANHKMSLA